jgi:hypothetical protein
MFSGQVKREMRKECAILIRNFGRGEEASGDE